jgi:hypothetical protein
MKNALGLTASALGVYAGLLGIEHGIFEMLQGSIKPTGLLIQAMGPPCQPEAVWHACFPAMTLIPNMAATGFVAILVSLSIMVWSLGFVHRARGGMILIPLSVLLLLVGGGFVPPFIGVVAAIAGLGGDASLARWRSLPAGVLRFLAALWPWDLILLLLLWFSASWGLGYAFPHLMLRTGILMFFFFDLALPLVVVLSAYAFETLADPPP